MGIKRKLRDVSKQTLRAVFELGQHLGFDLLPRHFYSEIPNIQNLRETESWRKPYPMTGVDGTDLAEQFDFVRDCCPPSMVEEIHDREILATASERNGRGGYGPVEADFLFAFVATHKPRQIFQIGCGVSTAVCLMAAEYEGYDPEVICVEPYPNDFLVQSNEKDKINLIPKKVENIELSTLDQLGSDLLFFVDSSHTLGPAGEVTRIILEMLPRLKKGTRVHFHDIHFPYDYRRGVLDSDLFFWHESALLMAFLTFNKTFRILVSQSMLHYSKPGKLQEYLPNYNPAPGKEGISKGEGDFPASTYLKVKR